MSNTKTEKLEVKKKWKIVASAFIYRDTAIYTIKHGNFKLEKNVRQALRKTSVEMEK